jgi:hypothetical protein
MVIVFDKEKFTKERVMSIVWSPLSVKAFVKEAKEHDNVFVKVYPTNEKYIENKSQKTEELNWVVDVDSTHVKFIN